MNAKVDVAVVGGGLSGLMAAALLARAGRHVTVIERSDVLGGRARSPLLHGLPVNLGPHALYLRGPAARLLRELGVRWDGFTPPTRGAQVVKDGALWPLPGSAWALMRSPLLSWSERLAFARVLGGVMASGEAPPDEPLEQWVARKLPPHAAALLHMLFRLSTYANAPQEMSAAVACAQLHLALKGNVAYLRGGFASLVAALAQRPGISVRSAARVQRVEEDGTVQLEGETLRAQEVVLALPPREAAAVSAHQALERFAKTCLPARAACLDVVLSQLPRPRHRLLLGVDAPLYAAVHVEASGATVLQLAKYLAPGESGAPARAELEAHLEAFQPGWRAHLVDTRFLPEMLVSSAVPRAAESGRGFGVQLGERMWAAADWAVGGLLADGGAVAAQEIARHLAGRQRQAA